MICLTIYLNKVLVTSQIKVKVTNKEPEASSAPVVNQEDILQEEPDQLFISRQSESMLIISEEDDEEFLSSRSPQVITIGNNDDEVETAEQVLSVDI